MTIGAEDAEGTVEIDGVTSCRSARNWVKSPVSRTVSSIWVGFSALEEMEKGDTSGRRENVRPGSRRIARGSKVVSRG
jgi:hypothetical protein